MTEKKLTTHDIIASKEILKINWTYNSNAIEGNTISLGDTAYIIQYGLTIKGKSIIEHNEVIGHARAIDIVYKLLNNSRLTEDDLFLLHKAVQTNLVVDTESPIGAYKVVENGRYVKLTEQKAEYQPYPHPDDIPHLMGLWFDEFGGIKECGSFEQCIDIYTDMHISFTAIHPFFDGNGRVGRLISNIPLLKSGFLPIIIDSEQRERYITLLSDYNTEAKSLNKSSKTLIEKNEHYKALREFFKYQYKNSKELLATARRAK
ncbi:MAG: Fic family protein [Campylobacterales bacterium]